LRGPHLIVSPRRWYTTLNNPMDEAI